MRFLGSAPPYDLTYSDVFMVPSLSSVPSRFDVDLSTPDGLGTTIPVVVANMTAVAGRRMAETVARRGGLTVLPQDIPLDVIDTVVRYVKSRHLVYDTPITLDSSHTVGDALGLIHKRAHDAVVIVGADGRPEGIFTERDAAGFDRFTQLRNVMSRELVLLKDGTAPESMYERLTDARLHFAPVVDGDGRLLGCMTRKGALRSTIYRPAVGADGRLLIAVAVGINGDPAAKAKELIATGVDVLVIDTAHGHQTKTAAAIEAVRAVAPDAKIVAGNVVTIEGTRDLINAGADIVKIFPSDIGGAKYLKALKGPLPQVRMMPTGGVTVETAESFLKAGACALGIGGSLVESQAVANGDFDRITSLARQFVEVVRGISP